MSDDPGRVKGDPGGELFVTPASRTTVWTDGLLATTDRLAALETTVRDDLGRVRAADACLDGWPVPPEVPIAALPATGTEHPTSSTPTSATAAGMDRRAG